MSIIGQAAREGFKDLVLKIIERRIRNIGHINSIAAIELEELKKEIANLNTD